MKIKEIEWTKDGINIKVGDRKAYQPVIGKVNSHTFDIDESMTMGWSHSDLEWFKLLNDLNY